MPCIKEESSTVKKCQLMNALDEKFSNSTNTYYSKKYHVIESGSNSSIILEKESDEFSKQMNLAKKIMKRNKLVLKRLADELS